MMVRYGSAFTGTAGIRSFPLCGSVLNKPLDSGLRRNDAGGCLGRSFQTPLYRLHPPRRAAMQVGLRWNDGGVDSGLCLDVVEYEAIQDNGILSIPESLSNASAVIPAKARLQGCRW